MSLLHLPVAPEPVPSVPSQPPEAVHLRRIIEKQPACLMRVGLDGLLLAANDAALGLLGAKDHSEVLGSLLTTWIVAADLQRWAQFAATVGKGTSVSLECDINDLAGTQRNVAFYAVPLIDHHDEIPSMILGARDESALRHLEASIQEAATRRHDVVAEPARTQQHDDTEWQDLKTQLERSTTEREDLAALLIESDSAHRDLLAERERLQQALAKQSQLEQLLRAGRTHLQDLRTKVKDAEAERERLSTLLGELETAHQEARQHPNDLRAQLDETISQRDLLLTRVGELETRHQQQLVDGQTVLLKEQEAQQRLNDLQGQLQETTAQRDQLRIQLGELEAAQQRLMTQQADLTQSLTDQVERHEQDLLQKEREAQEHLSHLRTKLEETISERHQLLSELGEREAAHQRHMDEQAEARQALVDQHEVDVLLRQQEAQQQTSDLRTQLEASAAEQQRLAGLLDEHDAQHDRAVADYDAERSLFERSLEDAASIQQRMKKALADYQVEHQSMDLITKELAPLAATGRLAHELGSELKGIVAAIDARAASLLAECPLESSTRKEIEALRSDAIRAAALALQMVRGDTTPARAGESSAESL